MHDRLDGNRVCGSDSARTSEEARMKVIGISGLENFIDFKKAAWPGLEEREYRIAQGVDASAALVIDGNLVVAADQARFCVQTRTPQFPIDAIRFCLSEAGITIDAIDEIAHGFDFAPYRVLYAQDSVSTELYRRVLSRSALLDQVSRDLPGFPEEKVFAVSHHRAHAACAAFTSGWDECLVVVSDAMGEIEGLSVFDFHDGELERIRSMYARDSIGMLYSLVALHLGFEFSTDEYKLMEMAAYGDPSRFRSFFLEAVELRDDGSVRIPLLRLTNTRRDREICAAARVSLDQKLVRRRLPGEPIEFIHEDVAAAMQECFERVILHCCEHFARETGLRKVVLAGGAPLQAAVKKKLIRSRFFDVIYISPAGGDDGAALGAALYRTSLTQAIPARRPQAPLITAWPDAGFDPDLRAPQTSFGS